MDPEAVEVFKFLLKVLPLVVMIVALGIGGSLLHTWLRIKNGYPLQNSWGMPIHKKNDDQLVERIVTDQPSRLAREIDQLSIDKGGRAS